MPRSVRILLLLLVVAGAAVAGYFAYEHYRQQPLPDQRAANPVTTAPTGRLVVLVVFDQMRGDYLARWAEHFGSGGFERMKRDGVWFSNVEIPYACTSTGPGHASLVTGAMPAVHGIIENEWWDRKAAARVYCCQPSRPFDRVPPLPADAGEPGRGAGTGFSPENLLAETVGDKLKATTGGKGRVFSLSIKDRTAVLMGGKMPDGVYCFDTRDGVIHTSLYYREQLHPWVAEFNATKLVNSWFDKSWDRFRPDLDYAKVVRNPDEALGEAFGYNGQGRLFPHPYKGELTEPGIGYYEAVECSPAGNELLLALAKKAITTEKLGQGDTTDLLCLSFSSTDLIGHQWGPDSWEVFDITLRADKLVADLLTFLDSTPGKDRYTLVLSADHGVCPVPEQQKFPTARRMPVNEVLIPLGKALDSAFGSPPTGPTQWFEATDAKEQDRVWPWVYLNRRAITARGLQMEQVADYARDWLSGRDYVEVAFTRAQLEGSVFPEGTVGARARLAYRPDRCGDVIVIPKPGVLITSYTGGTSHGSPQPYDSHIPVLAVGVGIPKLGQRENKVSSLIVAPILARALGIEPPKDAVEKPPF